MASKFGPATEVSTESSGSKFGPATSVANATTGGIEAPGIPKPPLPQGLQPDRPISERSGISSMPRMPRGLGGLPLMIDWTQNAGALLDNTESGGKQVARGATAIGAAGGNVRPMPNNMDTPGSRSSVLGGVSDVGHGALKMSAPVMAPAAVAAITPATILPAATGMAAGYLAGEALPAIGRHFGAGEGTQNFLSDAGNVAGGWLGAKYGPPAVSATGNAIKGTAQAAKDMILPPMKPEAAMVKGLRPKNSQINFEANLPTSMPEIKAAEAKMGRPISSVGDLIEATGIAKGDMWKQYEQYSGPAAAMNAQVDLTPVADAMVGSIPARTRLQNPEAAARIEQIAAKYRGAFDIKDAEKFLLEANSDLDSYHAKFPASQRAAEHSNPDTAHTVAEAKKLRDTIYNFLDQGTGAAREAKLRYGKLMEVEQTALRRKNVADRQAPESLSEQLSRWNAVGKTAKGALKLFPGFDPTGATDIADAWAQSKMASAMKERNTSDWLVKHAFENYGGRPSPIPPPPPVSIKGALGPGAHRMPGVPNPSGIIPGGPYMGRGMAPNNGMRTLPPPSPRMPEPLVTPPPADTSGIVQGAPNPYPKSGVMNSGQGAPMDLVPWVNPETHGIEYVPRGWRDSQSPSLPPRRPQR